MNGAILWKQRHIPECPSSLIRVYGELKPKETTGNVSAEKAEKREIQAEKGALMPPMDEQNRKFST